MMNLFNKTYELLLLKSRTITIKQANIFTTVFIFLFTVVFAYLLITENYHDYERALYNDKVLEKTSSDMAKTHQEREEKLKTLLIKNTLAIAHLLLYFLLLC